MRYTVLLKQQQGQYSATVPWLPACSAEGRTREEALQKLKQLIEGTLVDTEITSIEVESPIQSSTGNVWLDTAGMFADDPQFDQMLGEVEVYRRSLDEQTE